MGLWAFAWEFLKQHKKEVTLFHIAGRKRFLLCIFYPLWLWHFGPRIDLRKWAIVDIWYVCGGGAHSAGCCSHWMSIIRHNGAGIDRTVGGDLIQYFRQFGAVDRRIYGFLARDDWIWWRKVLCRSECHFGCDYSACFRGVNAESFEAIKFRADLAVIWKLS